MALLRRGPPSSAPSHRLQVATPLYQFMEERVLPGIGIKSAAFWKGFDAIVADL